MEIALQQDNKASKALRLFNLSLAALALGLGGMIYIIFRTESLLMFKWLDGISMSAVVENLRLHFGSTSLDEWIVYNLPDGLWLLSYMLVIHTLWYRDVNVYSRIFLWVLPVLAIGSEVLQLFKAIPGTFDPLDLLSYFGAILIFLVIKRIEDDL